MELHTLVNWAFLSFKNGEYSSIKQWLEEQNRCRIKAMDSVIFLQARMAIYYDKKHTSITFKPGDKVFITFATGIQPGYCFPNDASTKLSECRVGPFTVFNTIRRLAYKLDISKSWNIHLIISVTYLERFRPDKYDCDMSPSPAELVEDSNGTYEEYKVAAIIMKRYNKRRKRAEYLIQ